MPAPSPEVPTDPFLAYDGLVAVIRRLQTEWGANIRFATVADDVGEWDGQTRTILIDTHSPVIDQLHFLVQLWEFLVIGPEATDLEEVYTPRLRVVG